MKSNYLTTLIAMLVFMPSAHGQSKAITQQDDTAGQITMTNNGQKTVKAIDWELILTGEVDGKELKITLQFHNAVAIHPGEKIGLKEAVYLSKEELTKLSKDVMVKRIEYEDGTSLSYPRR